MGLAEDIRKQQQLLTELALRKNLALDDPDIYIQSCILDALIVRYTKQQVIWKRH